jgi:hypothetical protein
VKTGGGIIRGRERRAEEKRREEKRTLRMKVTSRGSIRKSLKLG